jgi:hypothetical protein
MNRVVAGTLICVVPIMSAAAQVALPKEGTIEFKQSFQGPYQRVALEGEFVQLTYDTQGTLVAVHPGGFGDGMTARCIGSARVVKGSLESEIGACEYTDGAGDKLYMSYTGHATETPGRTVSRGLYVGGTGKYAGIAGTSESTRQTYRGTSEVHTKGSYKLP